MSKNVSSRSRRSRSSRTDIDGLRNEDIDTSDIPELTPVQFARAVARKGLRSAVRKQQITLRIDEDVVAWFKQQGSGYQTRINELLRAYMEARRSTG